MSAASEEGGTVDDSRRRGQREVQPGGWEAIKRVARERERGARVEIKNVGREIESKVDGDRGEVEIGRGKGTKGKRERKVGRWGLKRMLGKGQRDQEN